MVQRVLISDRFVCMCYFHFKVNKWSILSGFCKEEWSVSSIMYFSFVIARCEEQMLASVAEVFLLDIDGSTESDSVGNVSAVEA